MMNHARGLEGEGFQQLLVLDGEGVAPIESTFKTPRTSPLTSSGTASSEQTSGRSMM